MFLASAQWFYLGSILSQGKVMNVPVFYHEVKIVLWALFNKDTTIMQWNIYTLTFGISEAFASDILKMKKCFLVIGCYCVMNKCVEILGY